MTKSSNTNNQTGPKMYQGLKGGGLKPTVVKRAYSKRWRKQWSQLKTNLSLNKNQIEEETDPVEKHHLKNRQELILMVMRTFIDYKYTNTGKTYK